MLDKINMTQNKKLMIKIIIFLKIIVKLIVNKIYLLEELNHTDTIPF